MSAHNVPWTHGKPTEFGTLACGIVYGSDGDGVAQVYGLPTNGTVEELPAKFAEYVASARLIAAAPDLLEALLLAKELSRGFMREFGPDTDSLPEIEAAIAKATGASL